MKKKILTAVICPLMLFAVLSGCTNMNTVPDKAKDNSNANGSNEKVEIPEDISVNRLSDIPSEHRKEIENLYGYYWADNGTKFECSFIDADQLIAYSTSMSAGYRNIRWHRVSDSQWICFSYTSSTDGPTTDEGSRVAFLFIKDSSGNIKHYKQIRAMNKNISGPYLRGQSIQKREENGKTFYVYDKGDPNAPKMKEPSFK
ncbi:MAG: hypothetical protein P1P65_08430 [Treponema sp.]